MKNIKIPFKIHITTYFFFCLSFLCGYFKNSLYIFLIVFIHEMGHLFFIKLFSYKVLEVTFYPFGGITKVDKPLNAPINKEMIISLGGFFFQGLLFLMTFKNELFSFYNKTIFLFNLLPIIPLDGSVFLHAFLEKFWAYKRAFFIYEIVSVISFYLFFLYNVFLGGENYFICGVLFWQIFLVLKQFPYYLHRFYLERYLYDFPYKKIANEFTKNIDVLKKETRHFFYEKKAYVSERQKIHESLFKNK